MRFTILLLLAGAVLPAQNIGPGCTTATMIDRDCDGYGPGSPLGPDADDMDPAVNTSATLLAKYGSLENFLSAVKKYSPRRLIFIATDGNDKGCAPNNEAKPCATFSKAMSLASAGDAVIWRGGTYTYTASLQAKGGSSPSSPSIYMNYPGEKVMLQWGVNSDGFAMDYKSNWIIDGLILKSTASAGAAVHAVQPVTVSNLRITGVETIGWYDGLYLQNGLSGLTIDNSVIHDGFVNGEHNIYLGCSSLTCPNLVIRGSIIYHSPTSGHNIHINGRFPNALIEGNHMYGGIGSCLAFQMGVSGAVIQNNTCHTVVSAAIWLLDYFQNSDPNIRCYDQNHNVFRYNTFIADGQGWVAAGGQDGSEPVYRVTDQCAKGPGTHDLGHNTFDSNVFVHWCTSAASCPDGIGPIMMYDGAAGAAYLTTDTWRNNILLNIGAPASILQVNGAFHDWAWFVDPANVPLASGNLNADPKFIAADPSWSKSGASWNLTPAAGSPAAGRGHTGGAQPRGESGNSPQSGPRD